MDSSRRVLQSNGKLFSNFELVFEFLGENRKFFKRIARHEYCSKCNVLYYITNKKLFFKFQTRFRIIGRKQKKFQMNSVA